MIFIHIKIVIIEFKSFKKNIYHKTNSEYPSEVIFENKGTNQVQLKTNNRNINGEQHKTTTAWITRTPIQTGNENRVL